MQSGMKIDFDLVVPTISKLNAGVGSGIDPFFSPLEGGLGVFLSQKNPGKRRVRDHRCHLGRARKSVWGE